MEKLLEQLAEQLNTTVPYLWDVLVQQATIGAWVNLISIAVFLLLAVVLYTTGTILYKQIRDEVDRLTAAVVFYGIATLITLFCLLAIPEQVVRLVNPEYWALNEIMETIKGD